MKSVGFVPLDTIVLHEGDDEPFSLYVNIVRVPFKVLNHRTWWAISHGPKWRYPLPKRQTLAARRRPPFNSLQIQLIMTKRRRLPFHERSKRQR